MDQLQYVNIFNKWFVRFLPGGPPPNQPAFVKLYFHGYEITRLLIRICMEATVFTFCFGCLSLGPAYTLSINQKHMFPDNFCPRNVLRLCENKVETCLHCMKISCLFFLLTEELENYLDLLTSSWGNPANPTKCGNIYIFWFMNLTQYTLDQVFSFVSAVTMKPSQILELLHF